MKKLLLISLIAQALVAPLLANKVLFIQNFQNNTKDSKYDHVGASLADMIISDIVALKIDGISVVEREQIKSLLSELKLQESEYFDQASTQKMGKGLGANYALAGSFTVMNGVMRIDARLINVTTSKIHSSFKTKGDEEAIFDLEADLVKNIGKGLEIDFGDVSRDKLSSPKALETLVKYADADKLMEKGDYKTATKILGEMRKSEPEFKLGKEAYKEAMKRLYAAKDKRKSVMSDTESELLKSALQKSNTKNPVVGFAYQWVLMNIYFQQMKNSAGIEPSNFLTGTKALGDGPERNRRGERKPPVDKQQYVDNLKLYVDAYLATIANVSKLGERERMGAAYSGLTESDRQLVRKMGWAFPGILEEYPIYAVDLATFLLITTDFIPSPCVVDEKYKVLGFKLMDESAAYAKKHDSSHIFVLAWYGDILYAHKRSEDAIAKWQEILDTYP
ncbi:CsgG/HfaB family protein, partial [Akkermansiaceae bacterium]|nr:CsgG/HfaB family protein [Akkermansiaceae bacterium]